MDYEYFKDKKIYDIKTVEELNWLKENSYINDYVYCGRKDYLENKLSVEQILQNLESLKSIFTDQAIDNIKFYISLYYKERSFNRAMLVLVKLNLLIKELKFIPVFRKFLQIENLKLFGSLDQIIHDMEIYVMKDVLSPLGGMRWGLWPERLVRDPEKETYSELRKAIQYMEIGDYKEAVYYFDNKIDIKDLKNRISVLYYNLSACNKFYKGDLKELEKIINRFDILINENISNINNFWNLTILKISLFYLNSYEFTKQEKYLDKYKYFLKKSIDNIILPFSDFKYMSHQTLHRIKNLDEIIYKRNYNIELIREYFLNTLKYVEVLENARG